MGNFPRDYCVRVTGETPPTRFIEGVEDSMTSGLLAQVPCLRRVEIHVGVGCSDSRDVTVAFNEASELLKKEDLESGVLVEFHRENVGGSFITPETFEGIKRTLIERVNEHRSKLDTGVKIAVYVHITAHGDVRFVHDGPSQDDSIRGTIHDLIESHGSSFNCGMMHAADVAESLEREILRNKPILKVGSRKFRLENAKSIEDFMKEAYGVKTMISAGWVKSINNLRRHALEQKIALENYITSDPSLSHFKVNITAGVQNYQNNSYSRVDGNRDNCDTFFDRVFKKIKETTVPDKEQRVLKQEPVLGLFHHSDIDNPRATALALDSGTPFMAGKVFAIGGKLLADTTRRFGAYDIVSFYYGVMNLGLKRWIILGRDPNESQLMELRLRQDPLMSYIAEAHKVNFVSYHSRGLVSEDLEEFTKGQEKSFS